MVWNIGPPDLEGFLHGMLTNWHNLSLHWFRQFNFCRQFFTLTDGVIYFRGNCSGFLRNHVSKILIASLKMALKGLSRCQCNVSIVTLVSAGISCSWLRILIFHLHYLYELFVSNQVLTATWHVKIRVTPLSLSLSTWIVYFWERIVNATQNDVLSLQRWQRRSKFNSTV